MLPLPTDLMAPMGAVIAALMLFAGLLHLGLFIVRRLKLPQDLPEGPHYEPPPPPVSEVLDPAAARAVAALQARRRAVYERAHAAARAAADCAEAALVPLIAAPGAPDPRAAHENLVRHAAVAKTAAEAAEKAMRGSDLALAAADTERYAAEADAALAACSAVLAPYPEPGNRRMLVMLIALGVVVAFWLIVFVVLPQPR